MAPTRRGSEGLLARVNFPLYTLQMLTNRHVLVAGGGGPAKTGIANGFEVYELFHDGKAFVAEEMMRHETGPKVVMNCACFSDDKRMFLVAGQESHCQLYNVNVSIDDDNLNTDNAKPMNGNVDSGLRKRKPPKSEENDSSKAPKKGNHISSRRLHFKFMAGDSVQTDFSESEPVQRVVRISRCGKLMVTGGTDGHIRVWKFPSMKKCREILAHSREIDDVDFSPDSKTVISVAKDGQANVWSVETGKKLHKLSWTSDDGIKYLFKRCRFAPVEDDKENNRVFTISNSIGAVGSKNATGIIHQWDGASGTIRRSALVNESLSALAVRDDGRFIAVGTMFTGSVAIYIAFSLQRAMMVKNAHSMFVTGLELLPAKGSAIATSSEAAVLSISVDNKLCIHSLPYRRTLPPWVVVVLLIVTLLCTFVLCSYFGL